MSSLIMETCSECDVEIQSVTFDRYAGLCARCHKDQWRLRLASKVPSHPFIYSAAYFYPMNSTARWKERIALESRVAACILTDTKMCVNNLSQRFENDPEGFYIKEEDLVDPKQPLKALLIKWFDSGITDPEKLSASLIRRITKFRQDYGLPTS